ncbi:endolytic transglycosylase MltG [Luminiphilus sp.]|nr:endolytic transglycosylase MltG [Luminiphilus sp.]
MGRSLIALLVVLLLLATTGGYVLRSSWQQPLQLESEGAVLTISSGESLHQVLQGLARRGWITRARWVGLVAQGLGIDKQIKSGEFSVEPQMAVSALLMRLAKGEVVQYSITFPEGITLREAIMLLHDHAKITQTTPAVLASALRDMSAGGDALVPARNMVLYRWRSRRRYFDALPQCDAGAADSVVAGTRPRPAAQDLL